MKKRIVYMLILLTTNIISQFRIQDTYTVDVNRLKLPISKGGIIANIETQIIDSNEVFGAAFDNNIILVSGGFALSGLKNGEAWSSSVIPDQRVYDYYAGKIGNDSSDPYNRIYVLKSKTMPFGTLWEDWRVAVGQGASFYDGDGDGIYNPVDLNGNRVWDANEDKPDMLGDVTAWSVYNDGVPWYARAFMDDPKKIEIKQTVFAYSKDTYELLDGVIFIRYRIENKSEDIYDSCFFSIASNPDIGTYDNDLLGCDTLLNAGYGYDKLEDEIYGNSPSLLTSFIQGAPVYIPGETFIDNNSNNIYDSGIDTPLDSASNYNGELFNEIYFDGAKNQVMTSTFSFYAGNIGAIHPGSTAGLRKNQQGIYRAGYISDVCNDLYGEVYNDDCSTISPFYFYSGDPTIPKGWIQTKEGEQSYINNSGPFTLVPNKHVDIIVAYIAGRGNTSLESVNVTKELARNAIGFYNTNFTYLPVGVKHTTQTKLPTEFGLSQNYPNPFNPSTKISYQIPEDGFVNLIVYNILGQEVAQLVNQNQSMGKYSVNFNAANLPSGVYIYKLHISTGSTISFSDVKKMLLTK